MKKRILTVLLAVCLVFALGTVSALADLSADCAGGDNCNHEAAIGTTHYDTLSEAIAAANNSTETTVTVTLLKNVSVTLQSNSNTTGAYTITRSGVTIDGGSNSYKITATAGTASGSNYQHIFIIQANNVTISNLEIEDAVDKRQHKTGNDNPPTESESFHTQSLRCIVSLKFWKVRNFFGKNEKLNLKRTLFSKRIRFKKRRRYSACPSTFFN